MKAVFLVLNKFINCGNVKTEIPIAPIKPTQKYQIILPIIL